MLNQFSIIRNTEEKAGCAIGSFVDYLTFLQSVQIFCLNSAINPVGVGDVPRAFGDNTTPAFSHCFVTIGVANTECSEIIDRSIADVRYLIQSTNRDLVLEQSVFAILIVDLEVRKLSQFGMMMPKNNATI